MNEKIIKTEFQLEKETKDMVVYTELCELMKEPGAMATAVGKYLCEKHNIYGLSTIWVIKKRVEKRLEEAKNSHLN
jgi:hypothetical protein